MCFLCFLCFYVLGFVFCVAGPFPIGLDCEWEPFRPKGSPPAPVATLQLGFDGLAVVIDVQSFCNEEFPSGYAKNPMLLHLNQVLESLFQYHWSFILGFSVSGDFEKLRYTCRFMSCFRNFPRVLELSTFSAKFLKMAKQGRSLSRLSFRMLGYPLNKENRLSHWDRRPLHPNQVSGVTIFVPIFLHLLSFLIS